MSPEVREVLDKVEDLLLKFDRDSSDLWNILSALRGPDYVINKDTDETRSSIKSATTVHIRRAAFPRLAANADEAGSYLADFTTDMPISMKQAKEGGGHFLFHITTAFNALNRENRDKF